MSYILDIHYKCGHFLRLGVSPVLRKLNLTLTPSSDLCPACEAGQTQPAPPPHLTGIEKAALEKARSRSEMGEWSL